MQEKDKQGSKGYWVSSLVMARERATEEIIGKIGLAAAFAIALISGLWLLFAVIL